MFARGDQDLCLSPRRRSQCFPSNPTHPRAEIQREEASSMRMNHKVFTDGSKFPSCTSLSPSSFPPTPPNHSPRFQPPPACPSLHLLAQNRRRSYGGAPWIQASAPGNREGGAEIAIRQWLFPHSTSLPSSPGQQVQGVWLQGDFKIPTLCQREEEGSRAVGEKSPAHCPGPD